MALGHRVSGGKAGLLRLAQFLPSHLWAGFWWLLTSAGAFGEMQGEGREEGGSEEREGKFPLVQNPEVDVLITVSLPY